MSPGHMVNQICDAAGVTPVCLSAVKKLGQDRRETFVNTIRKKLDFEITAQLKTACSLENQSMSDSLPPLDINDFSTLLHQLREKCHSSTTYSEKLSILTIAPQS